PRGRGSPRREPARVRDWRARGRWTRADRACGHGDSSQSSLASRVEGSKLMSRQVYLDHNASTPVHPDVVAEMLPYFSEIFGNPSSVHGFGRAAREGVDTARERVARFLGAEPAEIVFTSGGTESDNFGVKGLALARGRGHLVTTQIEHHAVLRTCQALEQQGFEVSYLPVDGQGMVDPDDVERAIRPDTIAVSVMHANSEVGTIQPIEAIGRI